MEELLGGFGKIGVAVRIVGGEDQVIVADQLADVADIGFVALTADHALALEILAGLHSQERRVMLAKLLPVAVRSLQPRGGPAAGSFSKSNFQLGKKPQHAPDDQYHPCEHLSRDPGADIGADRI